MNTRHDHPRDPGPCRPRGGVARSDNRSHRWFLRGHLHPVVMLLLVLGLPQPAAAMAERQATPDPDRSPSPAEVTTDQLIGATLGSFDLPREVDTLALARVTLSPGATARALNGAHLFVVAAGTLTAQANARAYLPPTGTPGPVHEEAPTGPPVRHDAGDWFLVSSDMATSPPAITNEETEPGVALVVSLAATGGAGIEDALTGWAIVEPLAVEDADRVGPPLATGGVGAEPLVVALMHRSYERAEVDPSVPPPFESAAPAARLLAVEAGALNVRVGNYALYRTADAAPQALPPGARISLTPGDQLLVLDPGRIATRNVARGPSTVLIVSVGSVSSAPVQG